MSTGSGSGSRSSVRLSRRGVIITTLLLLVIAVGTSWILTRGSADQPSTSPPVPMVTPTPSGPAAVDPSPSAGDSSPDATDPAAVTDAPRTIMGADWERAGPAHDPRDADEVLTLVVPLGCVQRSPLPRPTHVVEDTFAHRVTSVSAVLLRLDFDNARTAKRFLVSRLADLRACAGQPDDPYSGASAPVTAVQTSAGTTETERTDSFAAPNKATWTELFVVDGARVYGLAVNVDGTRATTVGLEGLRARLAAVQQRGTS